MKLFRKLLAAAASAAIAITSLAFPTSAEAASRAKEIVKEMSVGWNLGNTFDSININTSDEMKYETGWGNPETTKAMIDMVAEMGFSSIRIPVSWHPHVDGNNNISSAWLNRVKTVVDFLTKAGANENNIETAAHGSSVQPFDTAVKNRVVTIELK